MVIVQKCNLHIIAKNHSSDESSDNIASMLSSIRSPIKSEIPSHKKALSRIIKLKQVKDVNHLDFCCYDYTIDCFLSMVFEKLTLSSGILMIISHGKIQAQERITHLEPFVIYISSLLCKFSSA